MNTNEPTLPVLTRRKAPTLIPKETRNTGGNFILLSFRDLVILAPITLYLALNMCISLMSFWGTWNRTLGYQILAGIFVCAIASGVYAWLALWGKQPIKKRKGRIISDVVVLCTIMSIAAVLTFNPQKSLRVKHNTTMYACIVCAGINLMSGFCGFAVGKLRRGSDEDNLL